jgi:hypothetical protein
MIPMINLLIGRRVAEGSGVDSASATKYGLVAAMMPSPIGIILAKVMSEKEAESNRRPPVASDSDVKPAPAPPPATDSTAGAAADKFADKLVGRAKAELQAAGPAIDKYVDGVADKIAAKVRAAAPAIAVKDAKPGG